jgi:SAM-dependent methyltransferase
VRTADYLNFLPPGTPIEEPALTSGYGYPENIEALVARHRAGWVLDYGAGNRPEYLDNVVNLELAPYPSTDVMSGDMRLPFRDGCFDAIVTLAVLEHVREPWSAARELVRVLKPGGTLIADVPFLQPVHAYPSHFFNMTAEGLKSLFADTCDIESSEVPHYGRPIYTLTWFLQRYCDGLPPEQRAKFSQLRVADLLAHAGEQAKQDYVAQLPKEFNFELASVTTVVARKR